MENSVDKTVQLATYGNVKIRFFSTVSSNSVCVLLSINGHGINFSTFLNLEELKKTAELINQFMSELKEKQNAPSV